MIRTFSFSVAALALAFSGVTVIAQSGSTPPGQALAPKAQRFKHGLRKEMREKLGLTSEQATKLHDLRLEFQKAAVPIRANLKTKRLELRQLMSADRPDRTAIDRKVSEISNVRSALMKNRIDHQLAVREILSGDQWQKLRDLRSELRTRRSEYRRAMLHGLRPSIPDRSESPNRGTPAPSVNLP